MRWARIAGVLLVLMVGVGAVSAASLTVRPGLPFVWVRVAPSSYAPIAYTVYPTGYATLETTGNTQWDGYQTWAEVYLISNSGIRGWVEQGSLASPYQSAPSWNPQPQQNPYPNNPPNNGGQPGAGQPNNGGQPGAGSPNWASGQMYQPQGVPWGGNNGWNQGWQPPR